MPDSELAFHRFLGGHGSDISSWYIKNTIAYIPDLHSLSHRTVSTRTPKPRDWVPKDVILVQVPAGAPTTQAPAET